MIPPKKNLEVLYARHCGSGPIQTAHLEGCAVGRPPRFYGRQPDARNRAAGDPHRARDGHGVHLRAGGCLLGGPAGGRCHRGSRTHRIADRDDLQHRGRLEHGGNRHRGASYRRERSGRRLGGRGAGDSLRPGHRGHHGHLRDSLCAAAAGADGRVIRRGGGGLALHAHHARRQRVHPAIVPDQRRVPRGGRPRDRDAHPVAGQPGQPGARPVPDLRIPRIPEDWGSPARRSPPPPAAA